MLNPDRYTLHQNKNGFWEIRWTENRGDRYVVRSHSTREKERAKAETYRRVWVKAQQEMDRQSAPPPTMKEILGAYELNANTRRVGQTQYYIVDRLRSFFGNLTPQDIGEKEVMEYRRHRGVADGTLRRELGVLNAALNFAVRKKMIAPGDVPHIDLPAGGQIREVYLTPSEEAAFMEALKKEHGTRFALFCWIALRTGARKGAIETLTWDRVDLDARIIDYRDPRAKVSKKRRVPVPIDDVLLPVLRQARLFSGPEPAVVGRHIQYQFEQFRLRYPEFEKVTPHVLRHTAATRWLRDGLSLWDVAGLLGDTVETTTRVYGHHSTSDLRAAMSRGQAA